MKGYCYYLVLEFNKIWRNQLMIAKLYLADYYKLGKGVGKDTDKVFKYYKILTEKGISDA